MVSPSGLAGDCRVIVPADRASDCRTLHRRGTSQPAVVGHTTPRGCTYLVNPPCDLRLNVPCGSSALPDHGIERVGEQPARAAVEAVDVAPGPCLVQVAFDEAHVSLVV